MDPDVFGFGVDRQRYFDVQFVHGLPPSTPFRVTRYDATFLVEKASGHINPIESIQPQRVQRQYYCIILLISLIVDLFTILSKTRDDFQLLSVRVLSLLK